MPLIVRVFESLSPGRETFVSCKGTFPAPIDAALDAPLVVDHRPLLGPVGGLVSTMARMRSRLVFAAAGDAPFVTPELIGALAAELRRGDDAVVPEHLAGDGTPRMEPLAALYDRRAFLRAATASLREGKGSMHDVLARLVVRRVRFGDVQPFRNINTAADYEGAKALFPAEARG
jgi:molybdopterin-guanine dinucleotide biosynthesis protein A